MTGFW